MDLGLTIVEVDQFCEGSLRQKKKLKSRAQNADQTVL